MNHRTPDRVTWRPVRDIAMLALAAWVILPSGGVGAQVRSETNGRLGPVALSEPVLATGEVDLERVQPLRKRNIGAGFAFFGSAMALTGISAGLIATSFDSDPAARARQGGGVVMMHVALGPVLGSAIGCWAWGTTLGRIEREPGRFSDSAWVSRAPDGYHAAVTVTLAGISTLGLTSIFLVADLIAMKEAPPPDDTAGALKAAVAIDYSVGAILLTVGAITSQKSRWSADDNGVALVVAPWVDPDDGSAGVRLAGAF